MSHRILIVVNHAGFFLSHRLPVALAARDAGYEVAVATPPSRHVQGILEAGLPWHAIELSRSGRNALRELRGIRSLRTLYLRLRPHLVHHVTPKPVLYGTIAARMTGVPCVVNAVSGLGHAFVNGGVLGSVTRWTVTAGYRAALRHPRMRVIFQNVEQREQFIRSRLVRAADTELIPGSGVDTSVFHQAPEERARPPIVCLVSRLLWTKGVGDFVEAARELKSQGLDARFVVVGEPDPANPASVSAAQLSEWNREGSIEHWGRREDIPAILRQASIACLPSYYPEGVPKSLIEAAAAGLPIVTTDQPGCNSIVAHGVNGLLVPPRDTHALARALKRLLDDPKLREDLGSAGRARVVASFSLTAVVEAHIRIYRELLSGLPK